MRLLTNPRSRLKTMGSIMVAGDVAFPPERLTMQEEIKLMVEFLFGESGLDWVYERLGMHDHVDQELETMEDLELIAVHDVMNERCRLDPHPHRTSTGLSPMISDKLAYP